MQQITNISNEIARYAKDIVKNNDDLITATSKAIQLETMKRRMMAGEIVRFAYAKMDGSIRIAIGTLQPHVVKANIIGTGAPRHLYRQFAYIDLEKMAWRSFREENFIGTIN